MVEFSRRKQILIGLGLALLLAVTRGRHFATVDMLPPASWAVLFLAGLYLRPLWAFPALLAWIAVLDVTAMTWGDVSSFCFSPAYGFLLPAYGALWGAGRWYAQHHRNRPAAAGPLAGSLLAGATVCELISSGSFYILSGRFEQPTWTEFGLRVASYYPGMLAALCFYVGLAIVAHMAASLLRQPPGHDVRVRLSR